MHVWPLSAGTPWRAILRCWRFELLRGSSDRGFGVLRWVELNIFNKSKKKGNNLLSRCNQPIKDASVLVNQKPFHPTCFSCSTCQKPIGENWKHFFASSFFSRRKVLHGAGRKVPMRARLPADQGEMRPLQTSSSWQGWTRLPKYQKLFVFLSN